MSSKEQTRQAQIEQLSEEGYVVIPQFVSTDELQKLNEAAKQQLARRAEPLEFEADLQYPGAPASRSAEGGETVRRLLDAYNRDPVFARLGRGAAVREWMEDYFGESVLMSRVHHNCLMTKHPLYGSLTHWHRDIRYWSFEREELISVWFALGEETADNGGLWFVPGSHRMVFDIDQFDEAKFFRTDRSDNGAVVHNTKAPRLMPGDAVFFHCKTLHSAGKNLGNAVKFSLVYTYHGRSNAPKAGTRSTSKAEIELN